MSFWLTSYEKIWTPVNWIDNGWLNRHSRKGDMDMAKNLLDESIFT